MTPGTLTAVGRQAPRGARRSFLFVVLEGGRPLAGSARTSLRALDEVRIGRGERRALERRSVDAGPQGVLSLPDARTSADHARLVRIGGRWVLEDRGSKNGTRVNGNRETRAFLADGDWIEVGETMLRYRELASTADDDPGDAGFGDAAEGGDDLATVRPDLARELRRLDAATRSDVPVVVHGESGTGKELVARAIHARSGRSGRFVAVNCGALPAGLVESELFGHRRGSFSGATEDRLGLVRSADRGTLLLDEVGDLPPGSQAALLRVLQEREVTPVGDTRPVSVEVRFVCATHRDLPALVRSGAFRADLWARLAGLAIELPALRDRIEDLGTLAARLLTRRAPTRPAELAVSPEAAWALCRHDWPANVRELEQCLATATALAAGSRLELHHLPPEVRDAPERARVRAPTLTDDEEKERDELVISLRRHAGNLSAVARALGKDRKQIQRWVKRFAIDPDRYRP